jgi:DNA-binding response OmpR family regulator
MELSVSSQRATVRQAPDKSEEMATGLRVLLVEDDLADAHLVMRALNQRPNVSHIMHACDGLQALELLDKAACIPDIAIVDLKMPRMDGFRLLIELACRDDADFPIVVLTSSTARTDAVRSLFRGADKVIAKPHNFEQLERELALALTAAYDA